MNSHSSSRIVIYGIFFLSGVAALIYEISWSRQIGLLFGHTAQASSIILFSYFAGMALGSFLSSLLMKFISPLLGYSLLELAAAGWAFLIPMFLQLSESPIIATWLTSPNWFLQIVIRGVFCIVLLSPATICLGATLPLIAEYFYRGENTSNRHNSHKRLTLSYALNTGGGLCGVLIGTSILLPVIGVCATSYIAACISAACGLYALAIYFVDRQAGSKMSLSRDASLWGKNPQPVEVGVNTLNGETDECTKSTFHKIQKQSLFLAAISGFGTTSLEILYTQLFSLVFHNSTYTFGAVIAVFLAALALGAALTARLPSTAHIDRYVGRIACVSAFLILISILLFAQFTGLNYFTFGESFGGYISGVFLLVSAVTAPPVALLGMLLPLAWRSEQNDPSGVTVGRLTSVNLVCSALGAVVTSFVILYWLGLWGAFMLIAGVFWFASMLFLRRDCGPRLIFGTSVFFALLTILSLQFSLESHNSRADPKERLIRRWQSSYGIIDVVQNSKTNSYKVRQNLHYRYGETGSASREARQAHIPLLLHQEPKDVLFMGLGTGLTAGGATLHPEVESISIVELIPEVVEAARLLADSNNGIVDHPQVKIRIDDARHAMLASTQKFDVIVSDLFVPWESETGYLYTVEHYRIAQQRLKTGGIFCQWIPLYQLGEQEFESIADSFASVFPTTTIWWGNFDSEQPIVALVGTESSLDINMSQLTARVVKLNSAAKSHDIYLGGETQVFQTLYAGDWKIANRRFLNTDEHPRVEFLTPVSHKNHRLLKNSTLKAYFERVFANLSSQNIRFDFLSEQSIIPSTRQRASHHFILFGD